MGQLEATILTVTIVIIVIIIILVIIVVIAVRIIVRIMWVAQEVLLQVVTCFFWASRLQAFVGSKVCTILGRAFRVDMVSSNSGEDLPSELSCWCQLFS